MDDGGRLTRFVHAGIEAADEIERLQRELAAAERSLSTARGEVWREAARDCEATATQMGGIVAAQQLRNMAHWFRARAEKEQGK
jgi:hypothetical protein